MFSLLSVITSWLGVGERVMGWEISEKGRQWWQWLGRLVTAWLHTRCCTHISPSSRGSHTSRPRRHWWEASSHGTAESTNPARAPISSKSFKATYSSVPPKCNPLKLNKPTPLLAINIVVRQRFLLNTSSHTSGWNTTYTAYTCSCIRCNHSRISTSTFMRTSYVGIS